MAKEGTIVIPDTVENARTAEGWKKAEVDHNTNTMIAFGHQRVTLTPPVLPASQNKSSELDTDFSI
jgi:hypothetical protein